MKRKLLFLSCLITGSLFAAVPEPVSSFLFDGNFDDAKSKFTATVEDGGSVTFVTDATRGQVAYFPGGASPDTLNYLNLSSGVANNYAAVTYNMWFNVDVVATWSRLLTFATIQPDGVFPELFITPANGRLSGQCGFTIDAGTGPAGDQVDDPGMEVRGGMVQDSTWYMLTACVDDTHLKLYINGVLMGDSIHTAGDPSALEYPNIMIGKAGWPDPILKGKIDNFKVFNSVLSDAEVMDLYTAEFITVGIKPINISNMVVYTSNNQILIQNPDNALISSVKIYSVTGCLVLQTNNFTGAINYNLPSNIYIVKIQSNMGEFASKIAIE